MPCERMKQEEEIMTQLGSEGPTLGEVAREHLCADAMSVET